jgi:hypothetical protein
MTYKASDLSVLAYANSFTLWHYTTTDSSVTGSNYFNSASDMLRVNDLIIANIDTDGSPSTKFYIVTGNSAGTVTVSVYS